MKSKTQKREEAAARQQRYASLTTEQKIAQCRNRRGQSKRELGKLNGTR